MSGDIKGLLFPIAVQSPIFTGREDMEPIRTRNTLLPGLYYQEQTWNVVVNMARWQML